MAAAGIAHQFDHRFEILRIKLRQQPRRGIGFADYVARGGGVETAFAALV